jgi:hypothetical protein
MRFFDKWKKRTEPLEANPNQPLQPPQQPQANPQSQQPMNATQSPKSPPQPQPRKSQPLDAVLEKALFAEVELGKCFPDDVTLFAEGSRDDIIRFLLEKTNCRESRIQLAAWNELRRLGVEVPSDLSKNVLAVVLEVGLYGGVDYLAAYSDHTARYYNFSGAKVIWENEEEEMSAAIDRLFEAGQAVTGKIGLWDEERRKGVAEGMVRMSFLTPSGLCFGEGPMSGMLHDNLAEPVIASGIELMKRLMARTSVSPR